MAELATIGKTSTTITLEVSGLNTSHAYVRHFRWFVDGVQDHKDDIDLPVGVGKIAYTYRNLAPGSTYDFKVESWSWDYASLQVTLTLRDSTLEESLPKWSWAAAELNAFRNKGLVSTLTAARWNSFIDTINTVAAKKGKATIGSEARASSGQPVTADKFNLVNNCINSMEHTNVPWVSPGDIIYGSYFISMANALNAIP